MLTSPLPTLPLHPLAPQLCQILNNSPPPFAYFLHPLAWKPGAASLETETCSPSHALPATEPKGGVGVPMAPAAAHRQLSVSSAQNPHLSGSPRQLHHPLSSAPPPSPTHQAPNSSSCSSFMPDVRTWLLHWLPSVLPLNSLLVREHS